MRGFLKDTWVGPALESVWDVMLQRKRVFAFELWLHEVHMLPATGDCNGEKMSQVGKL